MKIDMEHAPKTAEVESPLVGKKRKMKNNKSRFSDEQIKSLETMFEEETKLEPQRKLQLARQLGLQPRQIAIWFQNKRARWKSKQLQREYNILKASYDTLASNFESLKKENQCLLKQLQKLSDLLEQNPTKRKRHAPGTIGKSNDADTDSVEAERDEHGAKFGLSVEERSDLGATACSDDENSKNVERFMQNETSILNMAEPVDASILIPNWSGFNSGCFSDQSCSSLNWWELWP